MIRLQRYIIKNELFRNIIILDYTHLFLLIFIYFSIESGKKEVFKSICRLLFYT